MSYWLSGKCRLLLLLFCHSCCCLVVIGFFRYCCFFSFFNQCKLNGNSNNFFVHFFLFFFFIIINRCKLNGNSNNFFFFLPFFFPSEKMEITDFFFVCKIEPEWQRLLLWRKWKLKDRLAYFFCSRDRLYYIVRHKYLLTQWSDR